MAKKESISKLKDEALRAMQARGDDKSDLARAATMTDEEIEAEIADDADEAGMVVDWARASVDLPSPKVVLDMRVDRKILDFFRPQGRGYQTRINAVLRSCSSRCAATIGVERRRQKNGRHEGRPMTLSRCPNIHAVMRSSASEGSRST